MSTPIRKVLISAAGPVSNLSVVSTTVPSPPKHNVQVAVQYSAFSGADVELRLGRLPFQKPPPLTPGYSLVGRVVANGAGATRFAPGTPVAALTVYDSQAERLNLPERYLVPLPAALAADDGLRRAAALVLDWSTAYAMAHRVARVRAGQRVFVHGLSGAVGYALLVLCRALGAEVFGTASERNHAALRELGATPFVYSDKAWVREMEARGGAHAVFDPLGFESWDESYAILATGTGGPSAAGEQGAEGGILVGYGFNQAALGGEEKRSIVPPVAKMMARNLKVWDRRRTAIFSISRDDKHFAEDLEALFAMLAEGKIDMPIKKVYDMTTESMREAHESWGKVPGMGAMLVKVAED